MKLPKTIDPGFGGQTQLVACVNTAISVVDRIASTKPEFFPEYTDHSSTHNEEVLETAVSLLTPEALELLSPSDYAALILSILLHDCGMHLSGPGFQSLIDPNYNKTSFVDGDTWRDLWTHFLLQAKRFDGKQLRRLFGTADPIRIPPDDPNEFTHRDRLLIGEFLRRHHPRLAHEIAIHGLPGVDGKRVLIIPSAPGDLAEVSGIIARSHGMPLRAAIDVMRSRFHDREYQSIHPPILMAALRIADYLQIQPSRAPREYSALHKISSPYSQVEWRVHQCVRNITKADADPEAIYVDAEPTDASTFLRFRAWARGIQSELDATWAALGEAYGRYTAEHFNRFQLKMRRIRTSIDDLGTFSKRATFLPDEISFSASSPDLLGLLVAPLYGNKPAVGLRELLQNSLDAVREREFAIKARPQDKIAGVHDVDVVIYPTYEGADIASVVVADRGIGMSAEIIKDYFLCAGASFRNSSSWRSTFADDLGQSQVARAGRFGVGALAAFLIGDSVVVETRRHDEPTGYKFTAELSREIFEVEKIDTEIGTTLTVEVAAVNRKAVSELFSSSGSDGWDWYCGSYPALLRLDENLKPLPPSFFFKPDESWVVFTTRNYESIAWCYSDNIERGRHSRTEGALLYCNNIKIGEIQGYEKIELFNRTIEANITLAAPYVLVTDKNGAFPLNLQRDNLSNEDAEIGEALRASMTEDLIAEIVAKSPESGPFVKDIYRDLGTRRLAATLGPFDRYSRGESRHFAWFDDRWLPAVWSLGTDKEWLCLVGGDIDLSRLALSEPWLRKTQIGWHSVRASADNHEACVDFLRWCSREDVWGMAATSLDRQVNRRFAISISERVLKKLKGRRVPKHQEELMDTAMRLGDSYVLSNSNVPKVMVEALAEATNGERLPDFSFIIVGAVPGGDRPPEQSLFSAVWEKHVGTSAIPLPFSNRQTSMPNVFSALGKRIEFHREEHLRVKKKMRNV